MVDQKKQSSEANFREVYQTTLRELPQSARVQAARSASGLIINAFCFDADHHVIIALIQNEAFGLTQARLVAKHHHTAAGLEYLTRTPSFVADVSVKTNLLRNRGASHLVLQRVFRSLDLFRLHNIARGQESTEQAMMQAREALRSKFEVSSPDQKARFIIRTEGRCLRFFYRTKLGTETAELLGAHRYISFILVRNLLSFPGLPAEVLRGMSKSPIIWRNQAFRRRITGHSNCPYDVKQKAGLVR